MRLVDAVHERAHHSLLDLVHPHLLAHLASNIQALQTHLYRLHHSKPLLQRLFGRIQDILYALILLEELTGRRYRPVLLIKGRFRL